MIRGIGTYIPTITLFAGHWSNANAASGASPITLKGGYTLTQFSTDKTTLQNAINASLVADQSKKTVTGNLNAAKKTIAPRIPQFNKAVQSLLPGTGYANSTPRQPTLSSAESKFLNPHQDMATLWATINADTSGGAVIVLAGGYTLAQFNTELTALRNQYASYNAVKLLARSARKTRDLLLPPAVQHMKQYRDAIQSRFAATDTIYQSLPALYPPAGSTPAPVENIVWEWNKELGKAKIAFTASPSEGVTQYVLRYAPGPIYKAKNETTVATIEAAVLPLEFLTDTGLTNPNTTALFRIYTVTSTGHTKGSATITVVRGAMLQAQPEGTLTLAKAA